MVDEQPMMGAHNEPIATNEVPMTEHPIEFHPVALSADGKRNAFYVACKSTQMSRGYAVCLSLIQQRAQGRLSTSYAECNTAMSRGTCEAVDMKTSEELAGKALFFTDRGISRALSQASNWVMSKLSIGAKPKPERKPREKKPADAVDFALNAARSNQFGDAINGVMKKAAAQPVIKEVPKAMFSRPVMVTPGESPLAAARRAMMSQSTSAKIST